MTGGPLLNSFWTPYNAKGVVFDNAAHIARGANLTGIVDGKQGTVSFWFRATGAGGGSMSFMTNQAGTSTPHFGVMWRSNEKFTVYGRNATNTTILEILSTNASSALNDSLWHHFLSSWDMAVPSREYIFVDGVDITKSSVHTDDNIDYTTGDWLIGGYGGTEFPGDGAEVWFDLNYLDISIPANLNKFMTGGKPMFLGDDGSLPTGVAPIIYQRVKDAEAASAFATNLGSGGGFTENGALALASTIPAF